MASLRPLRIAVIVALGTALGLAWNSFSGRGLALGSNAFIRAGEELREIGVAEARERLEKGALFLDARPIDFYNMSHVPGALPLPEDDFEAAFRGLEPRLRGELDIVVYCSGFGCEASHIVARKLRERSVFAVILQDGWPAWTDAGYPVREGEAP